MRASRAFGWLLGGLTASILLATSGCSSPPLIGPPTRSAEAIFPDRVASSLVDTVTERSVTPIPVARLAPGLIPPTNRWFSGLVFGDTPQPVFALPLSFGLDEAGFEFGMPSVTTVADSILGPHLAAISVDVGAAAGIVRAYDDASVTIGEFDVAGEEIGSVVIAQGSPVVTFTAARAVGIPLGEEFTPAGPGLWSATIAGGQYGLVTSADIVASTISLAQGESASWLAVPPDGDLAEIAPHVSALHSVRVSWAVGEEVTTTLEYESDGDSLVATMPHQRGDLRSPASCGLGSYATVYGTMELCVATTLSWSAPTLEPASSLDLAALDDDDKNVVREQLARDIPGIDALPADTYFGGKALYRLANLLDLAEQLGAKSEAAVLRARIAGALREWTEPRGCETRSERCFVYDPVGHGMVGLVASFGSDEFNDHHFHYGYFLYAASIAARHDSELRDELAPVVDLLAADLATSGNSTYFPERRVFDAYAGHSWASGFSPFGDGNNQESSSEAVSAWNGLALWAAVSENTDLEREARWMLASEAASALAYWTNFDERDAVYRGFDHSVTSLVWGGKRDYATWFSAEPSAKLAILLLPMSPVSEYLSGAPDRIRRNLAEAAPDGFDVQFGDYLLMYEALVDREAALVAANELPDDRIDDGNSRSYMLAWIMSRTAV